MSLPKKAHAKRRTTKSLDKKSASSAKSADKFIFFGTVNYKTKKPTAVSSTLALQFNRQSKILNRQSASPYWRQSLWQIRAAHLRCAFNLAVQVIGDGFVEDGFGHRFFDEVGRFIPAHVTQHHHTAQNEAAGIDLVFAGILGSRAVSRFKQGHTVANVSAGSHAQPANLGRSRIAHVIAVQVQGGDDVIIAGAGEQLLQHIVGNHIFDDDIFTGVGVFHDMPGAAIQRFCAKFVTG